VNLLPVEMPKFPYDAMVTMLTAESAAAFDELTRTGKDKLLTRRKTMTGRFVSNGTLHVQRWNTSRPRERAG